MKKALTILPLCMAVTLSASMPYGITALASPLFPRVHNDQHNDPGITPYYQYIQSFDLMVEPGPSEITYNIDIDGIDILKSVKGTVTLYKRNSSGSYEKKTSRSHSFSAQDTAITRSKVLPTCKPYVLPSLNTWNVPRFTPRELS